MPKISESQAAALISVRGIYDEKTRKRRKAAIFAEIKALHGIPSSQKIKFEIDNPRLASYLVIKDGVSGLPWEPPLAPPSRAKAVPMPTAKREVESPWPFDLGNKAGSPAAKPAVRGIGDYGSAAEKQVDPRHGTAAMDSVRLKLGSISLDDALSLLRSDGDNTGSYASAEDVAPNSVFVKNDRLYFVL